MSGPGGRDSHRAATTGAEVALRVLAGAGIRTCLANPGTTELPLIDALDRVAEIRAVLGLSEGVLAGACDGVGRLADAPAVGIYHLGPGLANGAANLHNARRAFTPVINIVGDHPERHRSHDPPLASDIEHLASWTGPVLVARRVEEVAHLAAEVVSAATTGVPGPATLVLPADCQWDLVDAPANRSRPSPAADELPPGLSVVAARLYEAGAALIVGGRALSVESCGLLADLRDATGCAVVLTRVPRVEFGREVPSFDVLPYFAEDQRRALAGVRVAVTIGLSGSLVPYFAAKGEPSVVLPQSAETVGLGGPELDVGAALRGLVAALGIEPPSGERGVRDPQPCPQGPTTASSTGRAVAATLPPDSIVVQEGITLGGSLESALPYAARCSLLHVMGGAIGGGLPLAVGAAIACPDRAVVVFQADGSSLYNLESLWTMAREDLDVTVILLNNRGYRILSIEAQRSGMRPNATHAAMTTLENPPLDFVQLAEGFGIRGERVADAGRLADSVARCVARSGPALIEVEVT